MTTFTIEPLGAGGEPVDLWRTFNSHGVASLPPMALDEQQRTLTVTVPTIADRARTVVLSIENGRCLVEVGGRAPGAAERAAIEQRIRHILRLDEDLSELYSLVDGDEELSWIRTGAGRMVRSASVFEEVVKTVCTTNCTWSATERMVRALVAHLGPRAPGAPEEGPAGRVFPTPTSLAECGDGFYREVVRAGYRGPYLRSLATAVAEGELDLESWGSASRDELSDDELEARLLSLPGVGPYAAAHIMMMLGRYSRLILDSWTRPKFARLLGRKKVADTTIVRRFKRYGPYAGLAFWLFLTRDWVEEAE